MTAVDPSSKFNHRLHRLVTRLCEFAPTNISLQMIKYFVASVRDDRVYTQFEPYAKMIDPVTASLDDIVSLNITLIGLDVGSLLGGLTPKQAREVVSRIRKIAKLYV